MVLTGLRRGDRVDAVVIPEMGDQTLTDGLVKHPGLEPFKVGERFGVALTGVVRVAPDNLLETAVLGHGQASSFHPRPPVTRVLRDGLDIDNREGNFPFANGTPTGADVPQLGDRSAPWCHPS
jgi:hypothetical protein